MNPLLSHFQDSTLACLIRCFRRTLGVLGDRADPLDVATLAMYEVEAVARGVVA